ncbi:MAG: hypothetical protein Q8M94_08960, partial [Ignavibacteria bacterium]|nr:hypothetical protein [Ignavibacteria bacterium]
MGAYSISAASGDTIYLHNVQLNVPADPLVNFKEYEIQADVPVKDLITIDGRDISADGSLLETHKTRHQDGGADEISVAGLSGEPAELTTHKGLTTGTHGVGAGTIAKVGDIAVDTNLSAAGQDAITKKHSQNTDTDLDATFEATIEKVANKGATGGYAGLTLFKINFKNALNTIISFFTNANTVARTYTFQDRDGTIADDTNLGLKANIADPTFTTKITTPAITLGATALTPTGTELNFVDGVTSAIQTQLDGKQASLGYTAENVANKDAVSGYAGLNASQKVVKDPANATATPTASKIPIADATGKLDGWVTGGGSGNVVGPASAVDSNLVAFDGVTGKLIKDSAKPLANVHDGAAQDTAITKARLSA